MGGITVYNLRDPTEKSRYFTTNFGVGLVLPLFFTEEMTFLYGCHVLRSNSRKHLCRGVNVTEFTTVTYVVAIPTYTSPQLVNSASSPHLAIISVSRS